MALVIKNPPADAGDIRDSGLVPELGRFPGVGHGNPLQYPCLENPMAEEPGGLLSVGLQRIWHDCSDLAHTPLQAENMVVILWSIAMFYSESLACCLQVSLASLTASLLRKLSIITRWNPICATLTLVSGLVEELQLLLSLSLPVQVYCAERTSQWSDTLHHEDTCRSFSRSPHRLIGCFLLCVMDLKRIAAYKPESRFSAGTNHAETLILDVPASRTMRNTQFVA